MVETITAIAIFSLIIGAAGAAVTIIYRIQEFAMEQTIAADETRRGADIMIKEIRQACYGDNGAYPIEKATDKEFVFYSDIDGDGRAEKVRYFLATINSETRIAECHSTALGGSCSVNFSNFLTGNLKSAQVKVSTEGYYGTSGRYSEFFVNGIKFDNLCHNDCVQCAGAWQGTKTYDITAAAAGGTVQFVLDSTSSVRAQCQWINPNHSIKARFEMSFIEEIPGVGNELRRGVIEPTGNTAIYLADQEEVRIITSYIRSAPPIFTYYDKNGERIIDNPSILRDTKMVRLDIVVNVNPNRAPNDYHLDQFVSIRNIKE